MGYKVIFMGSGSTFVVEAIAKGLNEAMIPSATLALRRDDIKSLEGREIVLVIVLDEISSQSTVQLDDVRKLCKKEQMPLFLMGHAEHIGNARLVIPASLITGEYKRPINSKNVTDDLVEFIHKKEAEATAEAEAEASGEGAAANAGTAKHKILVVDDSGASLHAIKGMLEPIYSVDMVNSGANALEYLHGGRIPDLILLDFDMPGMSGADVLKAIHAEPQIAKIPVIFLTGKSDANTVHAAIGEAPQGYILKSTTQTDILKRLETFFNRK